VGILVLASDLCALVFTQRYYLNVLTMSFLHYLYAKHVGMTVSLHCHKTKDLWNVILYAATMLYTTHKILLSHHIILHWNRCIHSPTSSPVDLTGWVCLSWNAADSCKFYICDPSHYWNEL